MGDLQVGGEWDIKQFNGFIVHFDIRQEGTQLDGGTRCFHSGGVVKSTAATGHVQNDFLEFTVTWDNNSQGKYTGFLRRNGVDTGLITGDTVDLLSGNRATWKSFRNFPL